MSMHPWEHTIREHRKATEALERAVQRPSLWDRAPVDAVRPDECVRCLTTLDAGRTVMCRDCWEET